MTTCVGTAGGRIASGAPTGDVAQGQGLHPSHTPPQLGALPAPRGSVWFCHGAGSALRWRHPQLAWGGLGAGWSQRPHRVPRPSRLQTRGQRDRPAQGHVLALPPGCNCRFPSLPSSAFRSWIA